MIFCHFKIQNQFTPIMERIPKIEGRDVRGRCSWDNIPNACFMIFTIGDKTFEVKANWYGHVRALPMLHAIFQSKEAARKMCRIIDPENAYETESHTFGIKWTIPKLLEELQKIPKAKVAKQVWWDRIQTWLDGSNIALAEETTKLCRQMDHERRLLDQSKLLKRTFQEMEDPRFENEHPHLAKHIKGMCSEVWKLETKDKPKEEKWLVEDVD